MKTYKPTRLTNDRGSTDLAVRETKIGDFTRDEKRRVFRGMVVAELEAGFLRYSRRQALMRYARKLGIAEFEACLLIAEAQFNSGDIEPVYFESAATLEALAHPESWSISMRLALALIVAIFADLLVIYLLFVR